MASSPSYLLCFITISSRLAKYRIMSFLCPPFVFSLSVSFFFILSTFVLSDHPTIFITKGILEVCRALMVTPGALCGQSQISPALELSRLLQRIANQHTDVDIRDMAGPEFRILIRLNLSFACLLSLSHVSIVFPVLSSGFFLLAFLYVTFVQVCLCPQIISCLFTIFPLVTSLLVKMLSFFNR